MPQNGVKIEDVMRPPVTVHEEDTLLQVLSAMIGHKTNSVLVVDDKGRVAGEVNVLELIKEVLPDYIEEDSVAAHFSTEQIFKEDCENAKDTPAKEFMIRNVSTVSAHTPLMEAAVLAIAENQSRIPVVDGDNKPIGVITRTEIKRIIGEFLGIHEEGKRIPED